MASETDIKMAQRRGWAAFINDTPRDQCPYWGDHEAEERAAWLTGWDYSKNAPHGVLI